MTPATARLVSNYFAANETAQGFYLKAIAAQPAGDGRDAVARALFQRANAILTKRPRGPLAQAAARAIAWARETYPA